MKAIKALNRYFFDAEEISTSDAVWFYGPLALGAAVTLLCAAVNAINL